MTNEQDIQNRCTFSVISNIEDESGNYIAGCTLAYHFTPCKGDRTKRQSCPLWGMNTVNLGSAVSRKIYILLRRW
jgi:hypothetical protein